MAKRVLIPLAEGFEEIEALATVDILRRAGIEVVTASLTPDNSPVAGRNSIRVLADSSLGEVDSPDFDMIVLPGGNPGTDNLKADPRILKLTRDFSESGKYVAAICAAPLILKAAGLARGRTLTSHPSVRDELTDSTLLDSRVAIDSKLITSQGPGTAIEFALKLVEVLLGEDKAAEVNRGVLAKL